MLDAVLKRDRRQRWAVSLRMKPSTFGWAVWQAGEHEKPVSTFINEFLDAAANATLQGLPPSLDGRKAVEAQAKRDLLQEKGDGDLRAAAE